MAVAAAGSGEVAAPWIEGAPDTDATSKSLQDLLEEYKEFRSAALKDARRKGSQVREAAAADAEWSGEGDWTSLANTWVEAEEAAMAEGVAENIQALQAFFERGLSNVDSAALSAVATTLGGSAPLASAEEESRWEFRLRPVLQDSAQGVLVQLAREWSHEAECVGCCARTHAFILEWLGASIGCLPSNGTPTQGRLRSRPLHCLVAGSGTGRLAFEVARALPAESSVEALDASLPALVVCRAMLLGGATAPDLGALRVHADLLADPQGRPLAARAAGSTLRPPDAALAAAARTSLRLRLGDLLARSGPSGSEGAYDAVCTVYVLDAVASLPQALRRIAALLRPGGLWLLCGADPLRYLHPDAGHFSWEEMVALLPAVGLHPIGQDCFKAHYVPGGGRCDTVRCLCCRKESGEVPINEQEVSPPIRGSFEVPINEQVSPPIHGPIKHVEAAPMGEPVARASSPVPTSTFWAVSPPRSVSPPRGAWRVSPPRSMPRQALPAQEVAKVVSHTVPKVNWVDRPVQHVEWVLEKVAGPPPPGATVIDGPAVAKVFGPTSPTSSALPQLAAPASSLPYPVAPLGVAPLTPQGPQSPAWWGTVGSPPGSQLTSPIAGWGMASSPSGSQVTSPTVPIAGSPGGRRW